jgi:hypothetical protein
MRLSTALFATVFVAAANFPSAPADAADRISRSSASNRIAQHPGAASAARERAASRPDGRGRDATINANRNSNVNINVNQRGNRYDWDDDDDDHHPIRNGLAFGAAASLTAHAVGSLFNSVPPGCPPYDYRGQRYYSCDGVWYYQADTVVYVVIVDPRG